MVDYKKKIIDSLSILQKKEQQEKNVFKARAYTKIISQLKNLDSSIQIENYEDLAKNKILGIGEKISAKIKEIIQTGELAAAVAIEEDPKLVAFNIMTKIYGVGSVKANTIIDRKITTISQLREYNLKHPKFLNENQKIGLKYYEEINERIPREEITKYESELLKIINEVVPNLKIMIVGSYRRGALNSGDIDILVTYDSTITQKKAAEYFKQFIKELQGKSIITDILAYGTKKCLAVSRLNSEFKHRRIDFLLTSPKEYPFALLYFTGSDKFNIETRKIANKKGYTLNEHELKPLPSESETKQSKPLPPRLNTEKEILEFLDIPYILPTNR